MDVSNRRRALAQLGGGLAASIAVTALTPGVARAAGSPLGRIFDVTTYMGPGVSANAAVGAALADIASSGQHGVLYFPSGTYHFSSPVSLTNFVGSVVGDGVEASILSFSGCDGLFVDNDTWAQAFRPAVRIEGLTFEADSIGLYTGLKFSGPPGSSLGRQLNCIDCTFRGATYGNAWRIGVELVNGGMSNLSGLYFVGHSSDRTKMLHAVKIGTNSTEVKITNGSFYWADIAILIEGQIVPPPSQSVGAGEGIYVAQSVFAAINIGVWSRNNLGNYISVINNHIDAIGRGVVVGTTGVNGSHLSQICNNLIFKTAEASSYFVGIDVYASRCTILGNEIFRGDLATGGGVGIVLESGSHYSRVIGNNASDFDAAIWVQAGAHHNIIANNSNMGPGSGVIDSGTANLVANNIP